MDDEQLDYLIAHVVLPPKLPQHAGVDDEDKDRALCEFVAEAATEFAGQDTASIPLSAHPECWVAPIRMLRSVALCHPTFSKHTLTKTLTDMRPGGTTSIPSIPDWSLTETSHRRCSFANTGPKCGHSHSFWPAYNSF